jgi:hypothetical protein
MGTLSRREAIDRAARDHAAGVVSSLLDRSLAWDAVGSALGQYTGPDRGVAVIHAELRSVAAEPDPDADTDPELMAILRRTRWFLRSELGYRWHDRGPVEIMGAYLGGAAVAWMLVAAAMLFLGTDHEAVVAGALLAMLLMVVLGTAMAVSLLRRIWWRYTVRRDGADYGVWPFFTPAEYRAAREYAGEGLGSGETGAERGGA